MPIGKTMNVPPEVLQFLGSLGAILALAWFARALKLGGDPRLVDDAAAMHAAGQAIDGYAPIEIARDQQGRGAILRDSAGRILLLKPHGNKFAGRMLGPQSHAQADKASLMVDSGERRFGSVTLAIDNADAWAEAVNALKEPGDA